MKKPSKSLEPRLPFSECLVSGAIQRSFGAWLVLVSSRCFCVVNLYQEKLCVWYTWISIRLIIFVVCSSCCLFCSEINGFQMGSPGKLPNMLGLACAPLSKNITSFATLEARALKAPPGVSMAHPHQELGDPSFSRGTCHQNAGNSSWQTTWFIQQMWKNKNKKTAQRKSWGGREL